MNDAREYEATLPLEDIRYLFATPEPDPFSSAELDVSGIDYLMSDLTGRRKLPERIRVTLVLPQEKIEADLEQKVSTALKRYCLRQMQSSERKARSVRLRGFRALRKGVVVLAVLLALSGLLSSRLFANDGPAVQAIIAALASSLVIAGWVVIWNPIDLFLYEAMPYQRERHIYRLLAETEVSIKPKPASSNVSTE